MSKKIDWGSFAKGCVYTLFTALVLFLALRPSKPFNEDHVKQERRVHEASMLERLKTAELPATVLTETGEIFWVVNRYEHNKTFIEAIIMWPDDTRDHRDVRTLVHNIKLVAGRNENREVQIILNEWWRHKTLWIK